MCSIRDWGGGDGIINRSGLHAESYTATKGGGATGEPGKEASELLCPAEASMRCTCSLLAGSCTCCACSAGAMRFPLGQVRNAADRPL